MSDPKDTPGPLEISSELIATLERLVDDDSGCFGGNYKWQLLTEEAEALIKKAKGNE